MTHQRRTSLLTTDGAELFLDRVDADLVAAQLWRMYPRLAQDIVVTPVQPTALIDSSDRRSRVAMI